jgi:hypothetical protein
MPTTPLELSGNVAPRTFETDADKQDDPGARALIRRMREWGRLRLAKCDQGAASSATMPDPFSEGDFDAFAFALQDQLRWL